MREKQLCPIFDGIKQHKAVSKALFSMGEDSSTQRNAVVIGADIP